MRPLQPRRPCRCCRWECPQTCCSVVLTWLLRNAPWRRRTPASAWHAPRTFRASILRPVWACRAWAGRATRSRACSRHPANCGRSAFPPHRPCLMRGRPVPMCASPMRTTRRPWLPTGKRCSMRWKKSKTASPAQVRSSARKFRRTQACVVPSVLSILPASATRAASTHISMSSRPSRRFWRISAKRCRSRDSNSPMRCFWSRRWAADGAGRRRRFRGATREPG